MDGHPLTLGSIVEESIEECEVVHTSKKKVHLANFFSDFGTTDVIAWS
jgi:hypothetical protein